MSKRQYAKDWKKITHDMSYSPSLDLYYYCGQHYDDRSAKHNGLIGAGAQLKGIIANENQARN